jgi:hypothetical protein
VFYISLLQPTVNNPFLSQLNNNYQPPPKLVNSEAEYTVKEILEEYKKWIRRGRRMEYLVKWVGYKHPI